MRIITEKDLRGLLVAFRTFIRPLSGERISQQAGIPLITRALDAGITVDALFNKGNWDRAKALCPELTAEKYVTALCNREIDVLELKKEENWHDVEAGFAAVSEAVHDFFMEVSGKGGKWNIPSAHINLAKAISTYSLQAIMSEELIGRIVAGDEEMTYFNYILTIVKDFNSLNVNCDLTEKQLQALNAGTQADNGDTREEKDEEAPQDNNPDEAPEDTPFPEEGGEDENDENYDGEAPDPSGFESTILLFPLPNKTKKDALKTIFGNYTPKELMGLVKTIDDGMNLSTDEVIERIVKGKFDRQMEDPETRRIHQQINADLIRPFVDCVQGQGKEMNEEMATDYDLLYESWDLRSPNMRKMHKMLKLIYSYGKEDPDLLEAAADIENLYGEE